MFRNNGFRRGPTLALVDAPVREVVVRRFVRLKRASIQRDAANVAQLSCGEVCNHVFHGPANRCALIENFPAKVGWTKPPHDGVEFLVFGHSALEHARAGVSHVSSDQPRALHTNVVQNLRSRSRIC
jgi:hypothetical protein